MEFFVLPTQKYKKYFKDGKRKITSKYSRRTIDQGLELLFCIEVQHTYDLSFVSMIYSVFNEHIVHSEVKTSVYILIPNK